MFENIFGVIISQFLPHWPSINDKQTSDFINVIISTETSLLLISSSMIFCYKTPASMQLFISFTTFAIILRISTFFFGT